MNHRLDPLLRPRSVAVVGASARPESMGDWVLRNLERGGYGGTIYPVNPGYDELRGSRCFASLADLPETPDAVVFAVGDHRVEQTLDECIALGVRAAVIMSSLVLDDDEPPKLKERVRQKAADAGMVVCGANGMGFYNVRDRVWCCGFDSRRHPVPGNASLISHSGSGMCGIIDCDERLRVNFAVSTGNELSVSMDEYMDFVLELPETRVVGLFIETARNPDGFRAALEKANARRIPVVALKVGRTKKAAELAVSHSGSMAGDDATYEALFDRYGVHRVADMDELATAMILFAELPPIGPGGLVALHDSGGERQLMVDLAAAEGVPLTELGADSVRKLEAVLSPELPAVNPLDGWSRGGESAAQVMADSLAIMMEDPAAALGALVHDRAPGSGIYRSYIAYLEQAHARSGKPVALVAARQGTGSDPLVTELTHRGYPVLDGVVPFLKGVRGLMYYRDFLARPPMTAGDAADETVREWRARLLQEPRPDESTALAMLADFGLPVSRGQVVTSADELQSAADGLTWPLVLKTAVAGIAHKTDRRGVYLGLNDRDALNTAWADLSGRLGPRAFVAEMAAPGVEMILGARRDPQFGPVVMLGFGGVLAEVLRDVAFALPPFDAAHARRCLDRLVLRPLLDGVRGHPAAAIDAYCDAAARFSAAVAALADAVVEIDLNPVIVTDTQCIAVDALVVGDGGR